MISVNACCNHLKWIIQGYLKQIIEDKKEPMWGFFLCRVFLRVGEKSWPRKRMNTTHLPELSHSCRRCTSLTSLRFKFSYFTHSMEHENQISREYSTERGRRSQRLRSQYIHAYNQPLRMQLLIAFAIYRTIEILRQSNANHDLGARKKRVSV